MKYFTFSRIGLAVALLMATPWLMAQTQIGSDINGIGANDNRGKAVATSADDSRLAIGSPSTSNGDTLSAAEHVGVFQVSSSPLPDQWSTVGGNPSNSGVLLGIGTSGSNLYVGGQFSSFDGVSCGSIIHWDGSTWAPLGNGTGLSSGGYIIEIAASGSDVYISGNFTSVDGVSASNIAHWNGTTWQAMGAGLSNGAMTIAIDGTDVYVGGGFSQAGGAPASHIAKWDGSTWSTLGQGLGGDCKDILVDGTNVYAVGDFSAVNGNSTSAANVGMWDGSTWVSVGNIAATGGTVSSLAKIGTDIYIGAGRNNHAGLSGYVFKWDGSTWSSLGPGLNNTVGRLEGVNGNLYAFGAFTETSDGAVSIPGYAAMWDGTSWAAMNNGVNAVPDQFDVTAVGADGIYIIGATNPFTMAGSTSVNGIARWDITNALPVELLTFTGHHTPQGHRLAWATATEENNEGFQIERCTDGRTFEAIGWLSGAGTTQTLQTYTFLDEAPPVGVAYYRLRQVDYNGDHDYSKVVTIVREKSTAEPSFYPNPLQDVLTIRNAQGQATLYNLLGQPIRTFNIEGDTYQLDTRSLTRGQYTLRILTDTGSVIATQLIK